MAAANFANRHINSFLCCSMGLMHGFYPRPFYFGKIKKNVRCLLNVDSNNFSECFHNNSIIGSYNESSNKRPYWYYRVYRWKTE